ncbi:MAG: four helix bundle protein [Patescibacteria group bacterium]|nr:four helix bundle protein [Patescibacteria group bacterium]
MDVKRYIELKDLEIYKLAFEISKLAWEVYKNLSYEQKIVVGEQFIRAIDSICANISEGYGRFHFLEKIKFCYNARGSLKESQIWVDLMLERSIGDKEILKKLNELLKTEEIKINNYISSLYKSKGTN